MTKFLRRNKEQLKARIYAKLSLPQETEEDQSELAGTHLQLDKALRQTEKKKLSVRKLISSNNPHFDFSDEIAQLKWRIDALKNFSNTQNNGLLNMNSTSLTGKGDSTSLKETTFDELYERQRKKFALLKERRKSKTTDPKYIQMVGNIQARKQKRKQLTKTKVDEHMKILNDHIDNNQFAQ